MKGMDFAARVLVVSSTYTYTPLLVNLAILDVRNMPRSHVSDTRSIIDLFLNFLQEHLEPKSNDPKIWFFIMFDKKDIRVATRNNVCYCGASRKQGEGLLLCSAKAEILNNVTALTTPPDVTLLFLFKKGNEKNNKGFILHSSNISVLYGVLFKYRCQMDRVRN